MAVETYNARAIALLPQAIELGAREVTPGLYDCSGGGQNLGLLLGEMISGGTVEGKPCTCTVGGEEFAGLEMSSSDLAATVSCQAATFEVKGSDDYSCYASGPAKLRTDDKYARRVGQPKSSAPLAFLYLESARPPQDALGFIEAQVGLELGDLTVFFCPPEDPGNATQVYLRTLESWYKRMLDVLGEKFDPAWFLSASATVATGPAPKDGYDGFCRPNEFIFYSGVVKGQSKGPAAVLKDLTARIVSSASGHYRKIMPDIMAAGVVPGGFDFSKVADAFTVPQVELNNDDDGAKSLIAAGEPNLELTKRALTR